MDEGKLLLIEYEMELVINKQLYNEGHISECVYRSVANMIMKDVEELRQKLTAAA